MLDKEMLNQLYRFAIALTRDEDQAYDLLQSSAEKYLKSAPGDIEQPVPYLKRSIRNEFIDQQRKQQKVCSLSALDPDNDRLEVEQETPSLESLYIQERDVEILIGLLSAEESELLYLWAVEEYTIAEIAELQSVSRGTLLSRMHRLKKRIKHELSYQESHVMEVML